MNNRIAVFFALLSVVGWTGNAQWTQTNGPYGGEVRALQAWWFTGSAYTVFAGTYGGGVFTTNTAVASWRSRNAGLGNWSVQAVALRETGFAEFIAFVGTDGSGVFRSADGGATWTPANTGLEDASVFALASRGTKIFAGTGWGVFRSTNDGSTWTAASVGLPYGGSRINALCVQPDGTILAGTSFGLYITENDGTTWHLFPGTSGFSVRAILPGPLVATTTGVWYRSGQLWRNSLGKKVNALHRSYGDYIYAGTEADGVYRSPAGSTPPTWSAVNAGLRNKRVLSLTIGGDQDSYIVLAGTEVGVFRSMNWGSNWAAVNSGLTATWVEDLLSRGSATVAGTMRLGVFGSSTNGNIWNSANAGLTSLDIKALCRNGASLFAGTEGRGVFRGDWSVPLPPLWVAANTGLGNRSITDVAVCGTRLFVGTSDGGVFRSLDNGASWTPVSAAVATRISALGVNGTTLFMGGSNVGTDPKVYRSTDYGASWTTTSIPASNGSQASSFAVIGSTIFCGTEPFGAVYRSTDNGGTWTSFQVGYPFINIVSLGVEGTTLFAAAWADPPPPQAGVFRSTNYGATWTRVDQGLGNKGVLTLVSDGTYLLAGTAGAGVWRRPLSQLIPSTNLIVNPGFELGTENWTFYRSSNAASSFTTVTPGYAGTKAGKVTVTTVGSNIYLKQTGFPLVSGAQYRLTFRAKSNSGRDMTVGTQKNTAPFTCYGLMGHRVNLTTSWGGYSVTFWANGFTGAVTDGRFMFWFATDAANGEAYYLDEVKLERLATPVAGVPKVTTQPVSRTRVVGQTATFSVTATGTAPLVYQWQKRGRDIVGATSASYTTPPVTLADNGAEYRCQVKNAWGVASSNHATLTVTSVLAKDGEESLDEILPKEYSLFQNYPNPFNPVTTIQYALPEPAHVTIKIYNPLGQEIATLVDEEQPAGYRSVTWDATNAPSGAYFCWMRTGSFMSQKKMLVIK